MTLLLILLALSLLGIAATVHAMATDGYRRVPVDPARRPEAPPRAASTAASSRVPSRDECGVPTLRVHPTV